MTTPTPTCAALAPYKRPRPWVTCHLPHGHTGDHHAITTRRRNAGPNEGAWLSWTDEPTA